MTKFHISVLIVLAVAAGLTVARVVNSPQPSTPVSTDKYPADNQGFWVCFKWAEGFEDTGESYMLWTGTSVKGDNNLDEAYLWDNDAKLYRDPDTLYPIKTRPNGSTIPAPPSPIPGWTVQTATLLECLKGRP